MAMAWIFTAMIVISVVFGMVNGTMDAVSAAALSGANDAITLTISLLGVLLPVERRSGSHGPKRPVQ